MKDQLIKWKDAEPPKDKDLLVKCRKATGANFDIVVACFSSERDKWLLSFCDCATPIESAVDFYYVYFWAEID